MFRWLSKVIFGNGLPAPAEKKVESQAAVDRWMADGLARFSKGELAQAEQLFRRAIAAQEFNAAFHHSLGCVLQADERIGEAAAAFRQALALDPALLEAHEYLGCALASFGDHPGALAAFDSALRINPVSVNAHVNRGLVLLSVADYTRGWKEIEWRWKRPELQVIKGMFPQPWWDGSDLNGRTILLFAEQGFGDAIQFVRFASIVAKSGARVVVDCHPPLKALFRQVAGVSLVLESDADIARFDLCCPLMGVPRLLGTTLDTIPAELPYLTPSEDRIEKWRAKLAPANGRLRVGLVWASNPSTGYAWRKSVPLDMLAPLTQVGGVVFYSLQTGFPSGHATQLSAALDLVDLTEGLDDFSDTAGLISNLDLIISVDTAVAHLAGAMGSTVWTLVPRNADWRWGLERDDSPWYRTMRLFRQQIDGEWNDVIERLATSLRTFAASRRAMRD